MKKLISLLLAVVMVMGMATVAFAADTTDAGEHIVEAKADIPTTITLAPGEVAVYNITARSEAAAALGGVTVKLTGDKPGAIWVVRDWEWGGELNADNGYSYETETNIDISRGGAFEVENTGTETATYTFVVMPKPGSMANPLPVNLGEWGQYAGTDPSMDWEKYFVYTNETDHAEILTIKNVVLQYNALKMNNVNFNIIMTRDDNKEVYLYDGAEYAEEISMGLLPGQTANILVRAAENEEDQGYVDVVFEAYVEEAAAGSEVLPIEVSMIGDYPVEGDEIWYAVNSMLAGNIIVVNGDDAVLVIGDDVIPAVDGIATGVLNGEGATIAVCVKNAEDMIIIPAPIEINAAGDYKATVGAGAEVEYAINSKLAGAILTVEGKDAYIYVNGTKYVAVDGVATAVLDGEGATIAVKVGNAGDASAEYALNIAYPPVVITATGDYKANVAAGAEVEYVVNSKLAGAILTVKGEKAYIDMNGTKVTAVNGVASVVLDGEGATISVKIGNSGDKAAEYEVIVEYAPEAINATGDYTANVPAGGEVEFVVNSKLDGAVVTVKGEGAYLIVNGKKVEGKDGVVTATLKAEAATISLIVGNAGKEAAQYTVNVDLPAGNPATGDFGIIGAAVAMAISAIGGVAVVAKKKEF